MNNKTVYLRISGGIGNQLFQYTYALAVARKKKVTKLKVLGYYQNHFWLLGTKVSAKRKLRFQDLLIDKKITTIEYGRMYFLLDFLLRIRVFRRKYIRDIYSYITSSLILDGFFQSEKDFVTTRSILNEIKLLYKISLKNSNQECDISNRGVIHVRAGDLLKQPWNQLCNKNYYSKAIKYLEEKFNITEYDVITEDQEYASLLLSEIDGVALEFLKSSDEVEDFNKIASYRYIICANSTFSWWAAVLGDPLVFCAPPYFYKKGDKPLKFSNEFCIQYE